MYMAHQHNTHTTTNIESLSVTKTYSKWSLKLTTDAVLEKNCTVHRAEQTHKKERKVQQRWERWLQWGGMNVAGDGN